MFNQKQFEKQVYTLKSTGILIIEILVLSCLITVASAATWTVDDSGGADFTMIREAIPFMVDYYCSNPLTTNLICS